MAVGGALAENAGIPTMFSVAGALILLMGVGVWIALSPSGAARVQAAD
jgi:hypothetical protein